MGTIETIRDRIRTHLGDQQSLVRSLLALREQIQGSLIERYGVCGKAGCACRQGERHGPYYVLSTRSAGRGGFAYLEAGQARRARGLVRRNREFRRGLKRLRSMNQGLVVLLKRYQTRVSTESGRRLGLEPQA